MVIDKVEYVRSRGMFCLVLLALFAQFAAVESPGQESRAPQKMRTRPQLPNIVIFLIDTLRADHLGVYGYDRRPTSPRIDELAREAVVFEQAYAPAPWTLPSVVSMMTSTFPCEHGTLDDRHVLDKGLRPLAERLTMLNYATFGFYANSYVSENFNMDRGFNVLQQSHATGGKMAAKLLDAYPQEPFYLYIHNVEPHTPHGFAPLHTDGFRDIPKPRRQEIKKQYESYRSLTRIDFYENNPLGTTDNTDQQLLRIAALTDMKSDYIELYDAAVRQADMRVGEVIDVLKKRGVWDKTLFVLVADHGEEMNEHGGWLHDQSVYEELIHVPLIIRFPQAEFGGRRVDRVVSLIDVMPTIFEHLEKPGFSRNARGKSLAPLLRRDADLPEEDFRVISMRINTKKYFRPGKELRGDVNIVVRRGQWKGIWNVEPDTLELYDLANDPGEQHDLAKENSQMALVMRLFAQDYYERCSENARHPPVRKIKLDDETLDNLRALGYVD